MAISRYTKPVEQTLEQYVPLPFQEMMQAGKAIQERGDLAEQQQMATQAGLSSMEALAPGYAQFRDSYANDFKTKASTLLDKYQGNTSNPEFIRDIKRLNVQFSTDPRLSTIKQGNELLRQNQQIAAKMKAEGKLFIQPEFKGVDERGNLTANIPGVEAVNTLEDWTKAGSIAHGSMEDIGNKTTNARNLANWKKAIVGDVAGQERLFRAYQQQGLSPEAAKRAVQSNITGLVNQYGKEEKINTGLLNYGLAQQEFAYRKQKDKEQMDIERFKAQTARDKALGSKKDQYVTAPSFNEFTNRVGAIANIGKEGKETIFGSGQSQYGTVNQEVKNQKISGKIYDISDGNIKPVSKTIDVSEGTLTGYKNAWVNKKTGELLKTDTETSKPKIQYINGKPYGYKKGIPYEIEERTVAEYNYNAGTKDKPEIKTFLKTAAPKEAMREMGYSNAYYEGMGRTQHGSAFDSTGKAKLDYDFIKSNIASSPGELEQVRKAEQAFNSGTASPEQRQLLEIIQGFDTRKSIYDKEILPYFENQGKAKNITNE